MDMSDLDPLIMSLAVAPGIGFLIGIERERRKGKGPDRSPAGLRTSCLHHSLVLHSTSLKGFDDSLGRDVNDGGDHGCEGNSCKEICCVVERTYTARTLSPPILRMRI
jgi:hypothetical protein